MRTFILSFVAAIVSVIFIPNLFAQYSSEPPPIRTLEDSRKALIDTNNDDPDGEAERFARWEYRMTPRLLKGGFFPKPTILWDELQKYQSLRAKNNNNATLALASNWKPLGPMSFDPPGYGNGGTGRVNVIRFHPSDTATIFVGTPDGGLWKTTNEGATWKPLTDMIPSLGVSDIAIDPLHPDTIYIATGDARAAAMYGNPYGYGILKTTDAGATWKPTGLAMPTTERALVWRVVCSPITSGVVFAGVFGGNNRGIQKSTDGGKTWKQKDGGSIYDIKYNPADPTLMYASGYGNFRRSTDAGETWTGIPNLPTWAERGVSRTLIAVTPADPNVVYVMYISHAKNQVFGLYRSSDKGLTFTQMMDTTNFYYFGAGGEYNLVLSVSPTDANTLIGGEQVLAKSTDGGATWSGMNPSVHWDNHAFVFTPTSGEVCYSGNDGGIYRTTNLGEEWEDLSAGLQITQYYRMGGAAQRAGLHYSGAQDNGIHRRDGDVWSHTMSGADGGECLVDYSDENIVYAESQNGNLSRSDNGGISYKGIRAGSGGHWITPYAIHPTKPNTIYSAYFKMYRSDNRGDKWTAISDALAGNDNLKHFAVAPSNDQVIYASTYIKIFKTTDGGTNWKDITAGSPTWDTAAVFSIAVEPTNPNHVWIAYAGFSDHVHVYYSSDGGATWLNKTGTLPNVAANSLVFEKGTTGALYLGTDLGVFYRDNSMNDWEMYMKGLPNVSVSELEINEASGMIRAATFGRGIWESPLKSLVAPRSAGLRLPARFATGVVLDPDFVWEKLSRTQSYSLEVASDSLFTKIVWKQDSIADTTTGSSATLATGTKYFWRVKATNAAGESPYSEVWSFTTSGVSSAGGQPATPAAALRVTYGTDRRYANIEFDLARQTMCSLKLYTVAGEEVMTLANKTLLPGTQRVRLNIQTLSRGVYYARLIAGGTALTAKLILW